MKWGALSLFTSSLPLLVASAMAHHSQNAFYKLEETVEVTGVVTSFALRNPHPEIVMEVTRPGGETVEMRVYAEAAAGMMKQGGWTEDSVTIGETITVVGNLARSSDSSMMGSTVTKPSGDVLTMRIRDLVNFGAPPG